MIRLPTKRDLPEEANRGIALNQGVTAGTGLPFGQNAKPLVSTKIEIATMMQTAAIQKNGLRWMRFHAGAWE